MNTIPKIVAPWGSYAKAMVACAYGADEVYVGVPFTSLRMRQNKIKDFDELKKTVKAIHARGKKALLTMNIFPRNADIKIFEKTVEQIADVGADAIIFSDPGTFNIIRKYLPKTPLHLSTQTSTMNWQAVKFRYDLGVKRIVLARELHIDEIKEIKKHVPKIELEVFVHGAMCMSYSGRCLLGDYLSGRPGNKGECSHACRFKYKVWLEEERRPGKLFQLEGDEGGSHILSSKDLCTIDRLKEIIPYVHAIKIEWRSKSEFYVGAIVKAYKEARDKILAKKKIDPAIANLVNVIPHREYRWWFLFNALKEFPEGEGNDKSFGFAEDKWLMTNPALRDSATLRDECSTTLKSAWPLFNRNYFWTFTDQYITHNKKKYFQIDPKEVIVSWMKIKFLSPDAMGELTIMDIVDEKGKQLEKANCNTWNVYVLADKKLEWWEILYE